MVTDTPQLALNRCIACTFSVMISPGTFACTWKTRDSPLSFEFKPIPENLPLVCNFYKFVIF